jgi:hypothetical protein
MRFWSCRAAALAAAVFGVFFFAASPAPACSICRCGDPTFNALGTDVYKAGALRVFLDWERFDKEQGLFEAHEHGGDEAGEAAGSESMVENRLTTALSYSLGERVNLVARIPMSTRRLTVEAGEEGHALKHEGEEHADEHADRETGNDLADPELYALFRLWAAPMSGPLGRRAWVSALAGVKTDWGENDVREDGVRLDEHLQAGTGSTDYFGGLSAVYLLDQRSTLFSSVQARITGDNDLGYEYGDLTLANVGYERKLGRVFDGVVELNFRHADRDVIDASGIEDPNTGGTVLYVTPKLSVDVGRGFVGRAAVQVPILKDLNGEQKERAVANVGLTYLF